MHPAFSVIFFTVSSGAGFGLFAFLYFADVLKLGGGLSGGQVAATGAIAFFFIIGGLLSSVLHLANPKNAWRAFSRFRTSWLSREGVFSVAFFPVAFAYLVLSWFSLTNLEWVRLGLGLAATALAWVTVFSTGMIYGCLKTIRQWNTPLVPANYLALGNFSGALMLLAVAAWAGLALEPFAYLAGGMLIIAGLLKAIYYFWIAEPGAGPSIQTATGFTRAQVRLLDAGHTHGTFLPQEFGFQIAREYALALKFFVFISGFILPLALLILTSGKPSLTLSALIADLALAGLVAERWLFFAEARHVVNLYHGRQRC
ncbi:MAG: dimethyl sulfoxide reductase anchor subunit [Hydrogenophilales bacterium]|nr:dimethyl sulfoxide reductase anchor subunit [Hydrogenophilales bacterium]